MAAGKLCHIGDPPASTGEVLGHCGFHLPELCSWLHFMLPLVLSSFASTLVLLLWLSPTPCGYRISFKPWEFTSPGLRTGIGVPPCLLRLGLSDLSLNLLAPYLGQYSVLIAV